MAETYSRRRHTAAFAIGMLPIGIGVLVDGYVNPVFIWGGPSTPPLALLIATIGAAAFAERRLLD